jgi:hypothetical protein
MAPKLDYGGQLAAFLEHLTDGLGCRLVDAEHGANMGGGTATDKRQLRWPETGPGRDIRRDGYWRDGIGSNA